MKVNTAGVNLSLDEHYYLSSRAMKAKNLCKNGEMHIMLIVDEANLSQTENIMNNDLKPTLRPSPSIGEILTGKLLLSQEYEHSAQTDDSLAKISVHYLAEKNNTRGDHKLLPGKERSLDSLRSHRL
ncbi:hypothetical protein POM88_048808 [Heracleum sosnowskyi]|uniref:Uncharacterized protein n=1 Tax=Heracleum sosnowskyi TaxID=360622 RepID=A0AAD8GUG3_9APIA|nr:hypothetical protein POM88_048808 [Heracleum sosnowskyi]